MNSLLKLINVRYSAITLLFERSSAWCQYVVNDLSIVSQTVVYTKQQERGEGIVELAVV